MKDCTTCKYSEIESLYLVCALNGVIECNQINCKDWSEDESTNSELPTD